MAGWRRRLAVPARTRLDERGHALGRQRGEIARDPHVDDGERDVDRARELVDGGAARQEVGDHGRGHRRGPGADALLDHAVIAGEDVERHALGRRRRELPARARPPRRQLLKTPEAAARLAQLRLLLARSLGGRP
jgi:hypothetical protein